MPKIDGLPPAAPDALIAVEKADIAVAETVSEVRDHPAVKALGTASEMADQPPLIALSAATLAAGLLLRSPAMRRAGARMLAAHLLATRIKSMIKHRIDRTRPKVLAEEDRYVVREGRSHASRYNSFPSGHTAGAVAVAEAIARSAPRAAWPARLWAGGIAAIQIPRCAHFVSDIAAGAVIGLAADRLIRGAERIIGRRLPD